MIFAACLPLAGRLFHSTVLDQNMGGARNLKMSERGKVGQGLRHRGQ